MGREQQEPWSAQGAAAAAEAALAGLSPPAGQVSMWFTCLGCKIARKVEDLCFGLWEIGLMRAALGVMDRVC